MVSRFYYVSHPEVAVDPDVPVPNWGLSAVGQDRAFAMLEQPWLADVSVIMTSPETKAAEMANVVGSHLGIGVNELAASHEIDRSATGFVTHDRHEALADRLFAEPHASADGWERAIDAQQRVFDVIQPLLRPAGETSLVVGHGGVGTLLLCQLLGIDIHRSHDQPGQGHYWAFDCERQQVLHRWQPIDRIEPVITIESADTPDVVELLQAHLDFAASTSPAEHVHALDLAGLMAPGMTFCTARRGRELLGVGAVRDLGEGQAEIKSMHTASSARGQGVARLMLEHLVALARSNGQNWVGLETGTMDEFAAARSLYETFGFARCDPFDDYTDNKFSLCMSLQLP